MDEDPSDYVLRSFLCHFDENKVRGAAQSVGFEKHWLIAIVCYSFHFLFFFSFSFSSDFSARMAASLGRNLKGICLT